MFNFIRLTVILIILFSSSTHASNSSEVIEITHPSFPEPLQFNIVLPAGYAKNTNKFYPLMFDFHPNAITYLRGMHNWLSHNGEWPWLQTIIVTPVAGNRVGMLFDSTGKTTPLLDFFEQQLFTEIDKTYRTNGFRIMSGFRVNGTIVLSTLLNKPNMIDAYIATSPEIANNYADILATANKKLAQLNDKPRYLLFSHGTNVKEAHQISEYAQLHQQLTTSAPNKLTWQYKHFSENYFMSLPILSTTLGIEQIFNDIHQGLAPTSDISQQGVPAIIKYYDYLTHEKYGFNVSPKLSIERLGKYLLASSPNDGLAILIENVKRYPKDANTHHALASAYAQQGKYQQAVQHQTNASALADKMQTWHKKRQRQFLAEYQSKLNN